MITHKISTPFDIFKPFKSHSRYVLMGHMVSGPPSLTDQVINEDLQFDHGSANLSGPAHVMPKIILNNSTYSKLINAKILKC